MQKKRLKKILIVDDELLILHALSKALSHEGVEIKTVTLGEEALFELSTGFYDLCFLDLHLPDSTGLAVMKKLKEISPQTKVVMMTSSYLDDEMKRAIDESAHYFVAKPFDISQVKAIAKTALEKGGSDDGE